MYPLVKVSKKKQTIIKAVFTSVIGVLCFIWLFLSMAELYTSCTIIIENTKLVEADNTKIAVKDIDEDGNLYLEDSSYIGADSTKGYIRVLKGTGTYYIPDSGYMVAEVSMKEGIALGRRSFVLDWVVFIGVCIFGWYWLKRTDKIWILALIWNLVMCAELVLSQVIDLWVNKILGVNFWMGYITIVRFVIMITLFYITLFKKMRRKSSI